MNAVSLRLLGRPDLGTALSREALEPGQVSQFLAYLAYLGGWIRRDELIALFWPQGDTASGHRNLRRLLYRARQRLGRHGEGAIAGIEAEHDRLRWSIATDVQACRDALERNDLAEVFRLWRGQLCDGIDPGGESDFHDWLEVERERLASGWKHAVLAHAERVAGERPDEQEALLAKVLALDPLDEEVVQAHLRMLASAGRAAELDRAYHAFARRLDAEFGMEPSSATTALATFEAGPNPGHAPPGTSPAEPPARVRRALNTRALPFVGREPYSATLGEHLARARAGAGGAVVVEGEAGVGKTRLIEEFLARAASDGVPVFSGRSFERELGAPLEPVRSALAGMRPVARFEPDLPEWAWSSDRQQLAAMHYELTAQLVQVGRTSGAAVLFIDDIQWADPATLEFLSYAAKRVAVEPVLVLVGHRREDHAALGPWLADLAERRVLHTLHLERLDAHALRKLLARMGTLPASDAAWLAEFVQEQTEGNPFYVSEYLRWLTSEGGLVADEEARLVDLDREQIASIELPENVLSLIWARYLGFGEATRDLLDLAAVTGRAFDLAMLERGSGLPAKRFWQAFAPLVTAGVMVGGEGSEYSFSHDKLRQTIYQRLGPPVRHALHGRVADALDGTGADPADLAHHHLRARNWDAAFTHLLAAAGASERDSAWRTALRGYERAEEIVDRLDDAARKRFEIWEGKERLLEQMDRRSKRVELVEGMVALAREVGDPRLEARAHLKRMAVRALAGDRAGVREARKRAMRLMEQLGDAAGEARVFRELAYAAFALGDDRGVVDAGLGAIRIYRALGDRLSEAATTWNVALAYRRLDRATEALEWTARAADTYDEIGSPVGAYMRHEMQAWAHRRLGNPEAARGLLERALELVEALGVKHLVLEKHMNLGQCLLDLGRVEQAAAHFGSAVDLGAQLGDPRHEGYPLLQYGTTRHRLGDTATAIEAYRAAVRLLGSSYALTGVADDHLAQADALMLLGSALADRAGGSEEEAAEPVASSGEAEAGPAGAGEALSALGDALAIASQRGDRLRASKVLMERGVLHWRSGRFGPSSVDFGEAAETSRHVGATGREIAALASRCVALLDGGRTAEGISSGEQALERLCVFPDRVAEAYVSRSLGRGWEAAGDRVLARAFRLRARRLLRGEGTDPEKAYGSGTRPRTRRNVEVRDADVSDS